jgi:hypothetical protein
VRSVPTCDADDAIHAKYFFPEGLLMSGSKLISGTVSCDNDDEELEVWDLATMEGENTVKVEAWPRWADLHRHCLAEGYGRSGAA